MYNSIKICQHCFQNPNITLDHLLTFENEQKSPNTYSVPNSAGIYVHFPNETLHLHLGNLLQDFYINFSENVFKNCKGKRTHNFETVKGEYSPLLNIKIYMMLKIVSEI